MKSVYLDSTGKPRGGAEREGGGTKRKGGGARREQNHDGCTSSSACEAGTVCNGTVHVVSIKVHVSCVGIIYVLRYHDYMLEFPAVAVNKFFYLWQEPT